MATRAAALALLGLLACTGGAPREGKSGAVAASGAEAVAAAEEKPVVETDEEMERKLAEVLARRVLPPNPKLVATPIPADAKIELRRTSCFGSCPVYRVAIVADGHVEYEGESSVQLAGKAERRVDPDSVAALWRDLATAFGRMQADPERHLTCSDTDIPSAIIELSAGGKLAKIMNRGGCAPYGEYEAQLRTLETRIDELAGTDEWVVARTTPTPQSEQPEL